MTPLPGAPGGSSLAGWRLDQQRFAATWDSGEGAFHLGGRWNSQGVRAVYCAVDPATAILEVAVHKTFKALDTMPHVLTRFEIIDPASNVHVVDRASIPNSNWLTPGTPSGGQQKFGDDLLANHMFILIPSTVSKYSWNILFDPTKAVGAYIDVKQEPFALDTRLHPPARP